MSAGWIGLHFRMKLLTQAGVLCIIVKAYYCLIFLMHTCVGWFVTEKLLGKWVNCTWSNVKEKNDGCAKHLHFFLQYGWVKALPQKLEWTLVFSNIWICFVDLSLRCRNLITQETWFFFLPVYDTTDCQITLKANESFDGCSAITGYCLPFVTAVSLATRMFDGLLEASLGQELHEVNGASICRACCWGVATAAWCWAEIWLYCSPSLKQICNTLFNPGTIINSLTTGFIS